MPSSLSPQNRGGFVQRVARRPGAVVSLWQRVPQKRYPAQQAIEGALQVNILPIADAIQSVITLAEAWLGAIEAEVREAVEQLHQDLIRETPFDPGGPNDPPLHASEAWKVSYKKRSGDVLMSVSNNKKYIQFLEERGGRWDHPGSNEPGWVAAAFAEFQLRLMEIS